MIIGITGQIGSGKSEVAKILRTYRYKTISADKIGHEVLQERKQRLKQSFGIQIVKNGKVKRKILGNIVFENKDKLKKLNQITHPLIRKKINHILKTKGKYAIDAALLKQSKLSKKCDYIFLVKAKKSLQLKRSKYNKEKTELILKQQKNINNISNDLTIHNNSTKAHLKKKVLSFLKRHKLS